MHHSGHFYPDGRGSGLIQHDTAPVHRDEESFNGLMSDEYENNDNYHMLWHSLSPDLNSDEQVWNFLEQHVSQQSTPPSIHQLRDYLLEEWCLIHLIQFQRLVQSMPWINEAVVACDGPVMAQHLIKALEQNISSHSFSPC